jgi:two-component system, NtrC family, nitrogen regulation sensor histidine kinase NtrY
MPARRYQARLLLDACWVGVPGLIALGLAMGLQPLSRVGAMLLAGGVLLVSFGLALRARNRAIYPLHTAANLLAALRVGDTSHRSATASQGDSFGNVLWEVNALAETLRAQRLKLEETDALLAKVVATTDIGIFAFDADGRLKLLNPAGARLMGLAASALLGRSAESMQLEGFGEIPQIAAREFPGASGRFEIRRRVFREGGVEHVMVSVSDVSRALREEERTAWQRLIRVLGHEVNNSLAPIKSISATLADLSRRDPKPADWKVDLEDGLALIGQRADALARFLFGYTSLARVPPPSRQLVDVAELLARTARLEQRLPVTLELPPGITARLDPDQIEQAVINLVRNAVDAAGPTGGKVRMSLSLATTSSSDGSRIVIHVEDDGAGLAASDNLFVPFFTTKPDGCGIGLAVARQIAEGHGGTVTLKNRAGVSGCLATLQLPQALE